MVQAQMTYPHFCDVCGEPFWSRSKHTRTCNHCKNTQDWLNYLSKGCYEVVWSPIDPRLGVPYFWSGSKFSDVEIEIGLARKVLPNGLRLKKDGKIYEVFCSVLLDLETNRFVYVSDDAYAEVNP